jgi:hypothetical protein
VSRRSPSDNAKLVAELIPNVKKVSQAIARSEADGSTVSLAKGQSALANDLASLKKAESDLAKGLQDPLLAGLTEQAARAALHRARLAVYEAALKLCIFDAHAAGRNFAVLRDLFEAVSSAQTGSGYASARLQPARKSSGKQLENLEHDYRARLVALLDLAMAKGNRGDISRLYAHAADNGMSRAKARAMVSNARSGRLVDPTFEALWCSWNALLKPRVDKGEDPMKLLQDPYSA